MTGPRERRGGRRPKPTAGQILATAPPDLREKLAEIRRTAEEIGERVWIVGGLVRDLLLERSSRDIDLVTLGSSIGLARRLAAPTGAPVRHHPAFLTADLRTVDGYEIDIVRARCETYSSPAVLPEVRPGSLAEDLFRRDFSANTMALPLIDPDRPLIDPFGGLADIEASRLRILHEHSFEDDPTRVLRGLRLARRLGFELEGNTRQRAEDAVAGGLFDRLSGTRTAAELALALDCPGNAVGLLPAFRDLALQRALHPGLDFGQAEAERLVRLSGQEVLETEPERRWVVVLAALCWSLAVNGLEEVCDRLQLARAECRIMLRSLPLARTLPARLERIDSIHERYRLLESLGAPGRDLARCHPAQEIDDLLDRQWQELRSRSLAISGDDLRRLGFRAGPEIGRSLEATLAARLEGSISKGEEVAFAVRWLLRNAGSDESRGSRGDGDTGGEQPPGGRRN